MMQSLRSIFALPVRSALARAAVPLVCRAAAPVSRQSLLQFSTTTTATTTTTTPDRFAVVSFQGRQFKVVCGDLVIVDRSDEIKDIGAIVTIPQVLMLGTAGATEIGKPYLSASVVAEVEEHTKSPKVIVFKKKRRKNYRRWNGHRQELTVLRIKEIRSE